MIISPFFFFFMSADSPVPITYSLQDTAFHAVASGNVPSHVFSASVPPPPVARPIFATLQIGDPSLCSRRSSASLAQKPASRMPRSGKKRRYYRRAPRPIGGPAPPSSPARCARIGAANWALEVKYRGSLQAIGVEFRVRRPPPPVYRTIRRAFREGSSPLK